MNNEVLIFGDKRIRRNFVDGEWVFSVVDVVGVLTESSIPKRYWSDLKIRLQQEGFELYDFIVRLKMISDDGKKYMTDCANMKGIFRIIQSISSKRVEPFKLWLAKVGSDRIDEIKDPELMQKRMKGFYEKKGYSKSWIDKKIRGIAVRQDLTDEWRKRGVEENSDFAILTAEISKAAFGMSPAEYKSFKGLEKENLRDHMTDLELIFSMLGEASVAEIERVKNPHSFNEHLVSASKGGDVARNAITGLEKETGRKVISKNNYLKGKVGKGKKKIKIEELR